MTDAEQAAQHAAEAERLLGESEKYSREEQFGTPSVRADARDQMNLLATQAVAHANLAVYYAVLDQARPAFSRRQRERPPRPSQ